MDPKQQGPSILMVPWLAHGHISPFLELAKKLIQKSFHIFLCSTAVNLKRIRDLNLPSIQLIQINLPSSPELPPHYHTTKDLPPHLMGTLKTAFDAAKPALDDILDTLKPSLVIYDFLQPWVPEAARQHNINAALFMTSCAASVSFLFHYANNPSEKYPISAFDYAEFERNKITQFLSNSANGATDAERFTKCVRRSSRIILIRTSKKIEARYLELLGCLAGKEIVPVGHLVKQPVSNDNNDKDENLPVAHSVEHPVTSNKTNKSNIAPAEHSDEQPASNDKDETFRSGQSVVHHVGSNNNEKDETFQVGQSTEHHVSSNNNEKDETFQKAHFAEHPASNENNNQTIMEFLGKKGCPPAVLVSFGSEYFLSEEEIEEVAKGLELSGVNFIWVVRFPGGERKGAQEAMPEGFLQRAGERGLVVEGWAPQSEILSHPNVGGFVSHCGWSSTLEAMAFGVPIVAVPMNLDQPLNARLVEETGVGLEVRRREGRIDGEELGRVLGEVSVGKGGEEIRRKARETKERLMEEGDQEMALVREKLLPITVPL